MIYLDNAATTWPKPLQVIESVVKCMKDFCANPGRSGHKMSVVASEKIYECREEVSSFFGLDNPSGVIFAHNATYGLNLVINGLIEENDHVICTQMDHNSVIRPLYCRNAQVSVAEADKTGYVCLENIEKLIRPNTKLIVMTHVSNVCGTVMPVDDVAKLARENGVVFLLDASQSAGVLNINVQKSGIDFMVCPGHKGLFGPMGTGIVCVNSSIHPRPLVFGGTGSYSSNVYQPGELPDRYESGTMNLPGICGLCEGVKYIKSIGVDHIIKHEKNLVKYFIDEISQMKKYRIIGRCCVEGRTGVVSVVHKDKKSVEVASVLDSEYNIAVRPLYHCAYQAHEALGTTDGGVVRISMSLFTTLSEIKTLLYALENI